MQRTKLNLKLSHKGLILVSVPLIFELIFVCSLAFMLKHAEEKARLSRMGKDVVAKVGNWSKYLVDANATIFMYAFSKDEMYLLSFKKSLSQLPAIRRKLSVSAEPFPRVQARLTALEMYSNRMVELLNQFAELAGSGERIRIAILAKRFYSQIKMAYPPFLEEVEAITREVTRSIAADVEEERNMNFIWATLVLGIIFNIILTIAMAVFYSRGITNRLNVMTQNTLRMREKKELNPPIGGSDEIATLDKVFHDMADALHKAEAQKQEFVSMISHDLRSPLTALQTTLAMAVKGSYGNLNEKGGQRMRTAEHSVERLIRLINELLDMEKMEAGMLKLNLEKTALSSSIERAVDSVKSLADESKVSITLEVADFEVVADEDRLVQVMVNLLSNAIKYSPEGSSIAVTVRETDNEVEVSVVDRGPGIPAAETERVFDRFKQLESEQGIQRGGSGLGLAICKAIVEAHGGTIGVESKVGEGSRFWFRLRRSR